MISELVIDAMRCSGLAAAAKSASNDCGVVVADVVDVFEVFGVCTGVRIECPERSCGLGAVEDDDVEDVVVVVFVTKDSGASVVCSGCVGGCRRAECDGRVAVVVLMESGAIVPGSVLGQSILLDVLLEAPMDGA